MSDEDTEIRVRCDACGAEATGDESLVGKPCMSCSEGTFEKVGMAKGKKGLVRLDGNTEPQRQKKFLLFLWDGDKEDWAHKATKSTSEEISKESEKYKGKAKYAYIAEGMVGA